MRTSRHRFFCIVFFSYQAKGAKRTASTVSTCWSKGYYGLWRLPEGIDELELRILPWQKDAPIYLPREADKTPGESVKRISIVPAGN